MGQSIAVAKDHICFLDQHGMILCTDSPALVSARMQGVEAQPGSQIVQCVVMKLSI